MAERQGRRGRRTRWRWWTTCHIERWGEQGEPVLLVHGSVVNGAMTWPEQRPLAERMHLVGHSYGGVVSLLAAARRPEAVRSLTVIEPPCFGVARDDPEVRAFIAGLDEYWEQGPRDPEAFLRGFLEFLGSSSRLPSPLPPPLAQDAQLLMAERSPAEAVIPLEELRAAPFPKLVVSGAHSPVFDKVCDVLKRGLGAERAVIPGARHSVQRTGAPFNERLEEFLVAAVTKES